MKVIRIILGLVAFVVVWTLVTVLVGLLLRPLLPGKAPDPISVDWAVIPASFVGTAAGNWVYQIITRAKAAPKS
jgi:hypothetical protein